MIYIEMLRRKKKRYHEGKYISTDRKGELFMKEKMTVISLLLTIFVLIFCALVIAEILSASIMKSQLIMKRRRK